MREVGPRTMSMSSPPKTTTTIRNGISGESNTQTTRATRAIANIEIKATAIFSFKRGRGE